MPFIHLGDDHLHVSVGNPLNSSCSGRERRSQAAAQFIEFFITSGYGHHSGSRDAVGSLGCTSQYLFDQACGLVMPEGGTSMGAALWGIKMGCSAHSGIKPSGFGQINQLLCIFGRQVCCWWCFGWFWARKD